MKIQITPNELVAGDTISQFIMRSYKRKILILVGAVLLLASFIIDVSWGPSFMPLGEVLSAIVNPSGASVQTNVIVWDLRLPIAIMAILVGAMLGCAGAEMQTILNNPLADPFTLGISSAASFGAAIAIVFQVNLIPLAGPFLVTVNAFVLALSTSFIIYAFTKMRGVTTETMVLVGIA